MSARDLMDKPQTSGKQKASREQSGKPAKHAEDEWFHSADGQKSHKQALEDIEAGRVASFDDEDDFLNSLKSA